MKKMWNVGLILVFMLILAACGGNSDNDESSNDESSSGDSDGNKQEMELKLADNQPEDYPTVQGDKAFAKEVEEKTNGRIKIDVYANGELGSESDVTKQVQAGSIAFTRTNASPLSNIATDLGVLSMPYLFESEEQKWDVLNGDIGEELLSSLKDSKLVGLTYYDSGSRSFYNSKRKVEKPEDLEGLKIRVQQSDINVKMIEALGASPTPMAYEEVYSSLDSGVIDGAENNFPSYYTTDHYKVAPHYTVDKHSGVPEVLIASQDIWNQLSEEDQEIIKTAAENSQEVANQAWDDLVEEAKTEIKNGGAEITEIPEDEMKEWREAVQPVYDEFGGEFEEYLNKIQEME